MGRRSGRHVDGILLLDKPAGITSNQALRRISRTLNARKAGHTGSLDPLATGLLVLCFGEATKVSAGLLDADKTYTAVARLGVTTDSADADGQVLERRVVPRISADQLEAVMATFRGEQSQIPPMFSALKHNGKRLYELARAGINVKRTPRAVVIHALHAQQTSDTTLCLTVACSKGTYIRTLVADIGEALGCGAHIEQLRRTSLGPFREPTMLGLDAAEALASEGPEALEAQLLPIDSGLADLPALTLTAPSVLPFTQGQAVPPAADLPEGLLRVYTEAGELLGMGEKNDDNQLAPRRLLVQRHDRG